MKIEVKRTINAPKEILWTYLEDFSNIHRFHPMLKGSHFIKGSEQMELGTSRQCDFKDGNFLHEQVTDLKPGSQYSIDITDSSMPIKNGKATLGLRGISDDKTEAFMKVEMDVTNPLMKPMFYAMYKYKGIPSILKGLEELYNKEHEMVLA